MRGRPRLYSHCFGIWEMTFSDRVCHLFVQFYLRAIMKKIFLVLKIMTEVLGVP